MVLARIVRLLSVGLLTALAGCGGGGGAAPQPAQAQPNPGDVVTEEFTISAKDDGIQLYLRNKHPAEYYYGKPAPGFPALRTKTSFARHLRGGK